MTSFILKKLLNGLLLVFTVSVLVFSMMHLMPGDPVDLIVDRKVSQERKDIIRHEYGYDRPLTVQYVDWIWKIISKGDFGTSLRVKQKVADMMDARIPLSLKLCGWMLFFEIVIAVPLGLLCAYKKDTFLDRAIINVTLFLSAIGGGVLGSLAGTIRLTKTEVLDVFREKYVLTAYAKGLPHKTVMVKHVMRNALILITVLVFMSIPWLISGAVITERIFSIPGMGSLLVNSIITQDYAVVQGCILIIAVLTVVFNTLSDVVVGMLDPRIRITMNGGAGA